ncbi:MAG: hypothetical protein KKF65_07485 [Nanoarchaeota archaeon]|nr:hypothetical protein [Nanoarchaeota archaeon]
METIQQIKSVSGKNFPEKKIRAVSVVATIWSNNAVNKDGETVSYKTISFERTYKDKNNEWQTTNSLRMNDLPKANLVLTKAYEYLALSDNIVEEEV